MISDTINQQITDAMKAKDDVRVATLKLLSSELHNFHIDHPDMTAEDEITVVKKEVKKRKDAIDAYQKAGAQDRVDRETQELKILEEFLPEQMADSDLQKIIDEAISQTGATDVKHMGMVIGAVMKKVGNSADGAKVALLIKEKLS